MSFFGELKRRNVVKVGAAYLIVAWLLIQVASTVLPTFDAPRWAIQTLTFVLILGYPVALVLAWVYELTPEGIKRTGNVPSTKHHARDRPEAQLRNHRRPCALARVRSRRQLCAR